MGYSNSCIFSTFKNVKTLSISNIVGGLLFVHSNKYE